MGIGGPQNDAFREVYDTLGQRITDASNAPLASPLLSQLQSTNLGQAQTVDVDPQYGAGGLGQLAGLAAALQGPEAVARQGKRIQESGAARRQQKQFNKQMTAQHEK
jgi:hypothetical protein